jgi:phosphoglycolate phosphatase
MGYRLVMFDFDGTLADTFPLFRVLCAEITEKFGLRRIAPHEVDTLRGMDTAGILASLGVSRWQLPSIMQHARVRMSEQRHEISMFSGMDEVLRLLAANGTALAVVSSNSETTVRAVLGPALCEHVHSFSCGVGLFGKANKVRRVLRAARVQPTTAALVGDESRDIEAARRAGVAAIAVTWGYATESALSGADARCDTVAELRATLLG